MKKKKLRKIIRKKDADTVVIDRIELLKQLRRSSVKKGKVIQPKGSYNRKDRSWKKDI
jgi:hypothetical protein